MTIYDSGNGWAVSSKDVQKPHLTWFSFQSTLVWPPIFQTHPTTVSQQRWVYSLSDPWEQNDQQWEAAGGMESPSVHMVSEARLGELKHPAQGHSWRAVDSSCGLWVQECNIFLKLLPIISNLECKLLLAESRPLESKQIDFLSIWCYFILKEFLDQEYSCFLTLFDHHFLF